MGGCAANAGDQNQPQSKQRPYCSHTVLHSERIVVHVDDLPETDATSRSDDQRNMPPMMELDGWRAWPVGAIERAGGGGVLGFPPHFQREIPHPSIAVNQPPRTRFGSVKPPRNKENGSRRPAL